MSGAAVAGIEWCNSEKTTRNEELCDDEKKMNSEFINTSSSAHSVILKLILWYNSCFGCFRVGNEAIAAWSSPSRNKKEKKRTKMRIKNKKET